jgi:diguanylate cyclase (GGDEF)-like protein
VKLERKVGYILNNIILIISVLMNLIFLLIFYKLDSYSKKIIIEYKLVFIVIIFFIIISNCLVYIFINRKKYKSLKVNEESIEKVVYSEAKEEINIHIDKFINIENNLIEDGNNYSNILNAMSNAFFHLKAIENENGEFIDGIIIDLNYAAIELLNKSKNEIINHKLSEVYNNFLVYKNDFLKILKRINKTKSECISKELKITDDKWGVVSIYYISEDSFSIIINDVTEIKMHSDKMEYLANYDTLTNLLNRHNLLEYLIQLVSKNEDFTIYFIDLDDFKNINDTLGHNTGDEVLRIAADRLFLLSAEDNNIVVGRLGGDEFLVIKKGKNTTNEIKQLAERILMILNEKFQYNNDDFKLRASIGISSYPVDSDEVFTLLKYADIAMYQGKKNGGCKFKLFSEKMIEDLELQSSLSSAIDKYEFEVYYQPIYDVNKEKIIGAEALTRWNSLNGIISPGKYIPLAKKSRDIIKLDEFVLREACRCCKIISDIIGKGFIVSVNISYIAIKQTDFISKLCKIIDEEKIDPNYIKLEITEDEIIDDIDFVVNILNKLRTLGFKIALDDFGIGYSSFNYIKKLPLDTLKIDRSLLINLEEDKKTLAIIKTLINLSQTLDLSVVCEGVESGSQLKLLKSINCDEIQGYFISKPIDFNTFKEFIIRFNKLSDKSLIL